MRKKAPRDRTPPARPLAPTIGKTVAEFFSGIGLMRLGLDQAGWTTVFANDIEEEKAEMYRHNFNPLPELVLL